MSVKAERRFVFMGAAERSHRSRAHASAGRAKAGAARAGYARNIGPVRASAFAGGGTQWCACAGLTTGFLSSADVGGSVRFRAFLETELIKELYFLADEQRAGRARAPVVGEGSALVERARAAIEASLFAPFAMAALARACHASESSLTRAFKQALGITPGAYVRERRLDEAMPLLESGRYSVGEVATRVGYARQAAFAAAFQRKFHVAPSSVRPKPGAPPLAPHGRPPVRAPRAGR